MRALWVLPLVPMGGCMLAVHGFDRERQDVARVDAAVSEVDLEVSSGDVSVAVDDAGSSTVITRTLHWTGAPPCTTSAYDEGVVTLADGCDNGRCAVDYDVSLPASAAIAVTGGSGDISVSGVADPVDLQLGSGDISLSALAGDLEAETGSGDIVGEALASPSSAVTTGSGDVSLTFDAIPVEVYIVTSSGDVSLFVPSGSYRIDAHSSSGDVSVSGLETSDVGPLLSVDVSSGDISIVGR